MTRILPMLAVAILGVPGSTSPDPPDADPPRVVEVQMIDRSTTEFVFEPSRIEVRPGDVVRFVQQGVMPHNVEFKETPDGAALEGVRMGPYLTQKGETYEIVIDGRFPTGAYDIVCTPHQFLGMTGVLIVSDRAPASPASRRKNDEQAS